MNWTKKAIKKWLYLHGSLISIRYNPSMSITYDKSKGMFYTQEKFIRKILKNISLTKINSILEPSFGSGILFISIIEYLVNNGENVNEVVEKSTLIELDKNNFEYGLAKVNKFLENIGVKSRPKYINGDFLDFNGGTFDLVITNPPYIRLKNIEKHVKKKIEKMDDFSLTGNYDMYIIFMSKILSEIDFKQVISIIPQSFLSAKYSKPLFEKLLPLIKTIFTFSEPVKFDRTSYSTTVINVREGNDSLKFYKDWNESEYFDHRTKIQLTSCNGVATIKNSFFILPNNMNGKYVYDAVWPNKKSKKIFFPYTIDGKPIDCKMLRMDNKLLFNLVIDRISKLENDKNYKGWPSLKNFQYGRSQYIKKVGESKRKYLVSTFQNPEQNIRIKRLYQNQVPMGGIIVYGTSKNIKEAIKKTYKFTNSKNGGYVQISTANFRKENYEN